MRAVMLAGGRGTRLAPYTTVLPKPLLPIGDVPVAEILIRQLSAAGVGRVTIAVGHLAGLLQAYFGDGSRFGVEIDYSVEEDACGTAGPLALVEDLEDEFLVVNGDLLTTLDFAAMIDFHRSAAATLATVGVFRHELQMELGVLQIRGDDVIGYTEKPRQTYEVSVGAYVMDPTVVDLIPRDRAFDLPELVERLIAEGRTVKAFRFNGYWLDIGRSQHLAEATDLFNRERARFLPIDP
jgi:NDP-sugar pyrophosphorylase family protein